MSIDVTAQMYQLTQIMKEVYANLDVETKKVVLDMGSDDTLVMEKLNDAITPEIAAKLKEIELPPQFDIEQSNGLRVEAYIEDAMGSDDPAIAAAAQEYRDVEEKVMNPESKHENGPSMS